MSLRIHFTLLLAASWLAIARPTAVTPLSSDVRAFGAKGDGVAKDTAAIQRAIDDAAGRGGGVIRFTAGRYLSGTIHLKSGITIELEAGATLAMSPDNADFDPLEKLSYNSYADDETTDFHY